MGTRKEMSWLRCQASELYDAALNVLYPQKCMVCQAASIERRANMPACAVCWSETRIFSDKDVQCWKCGALAPGQTSEAIKEKRTDIRCGRCDAEEFTAARAIGAYEGALRSCALFLKRQPHVAAHLARLLFEVQTSAPLNRATRIVPVPLHEKRERERGFNQATVLGRALAARTQLPLDEWSLVRHLHMERHRAGMDTLSRRESVSGAFAVRHPRLVEGERILLVDDVFTTGATVSSCASALKKAGAEEVFVLTISRV